MAYIKGERRSQLTLLPSSVDEYISEENPSRLIDAFVESLDMKECGFVRYEPAPTGTPGYDPRDLLKLYIYAYFNKIRSSRKIAKETTRNVEVMWLIEKLTPDFRTISDFRKDNVKALKVVYRKWNLLCDKLGLYGKEYVSIDGSKFKAVNAKDRNFTLSKLDARLKRIDNNIDDYMIMLDNADAEETDERAFTKSEIEEKIKDLRTRKETYEGYLHEIETSDHGLIEEVADSVREEFELDTIEAVADKGYQDKDDMVSCLEKGIVPNVHPNQRGAAHTLQTNYEPATISEAQQKSTSPEDIGECLRAGVIPEIYKGVISDIEIVEERDFHRGIMPIGYAELPDLVEQMLDKAKDGYYVRDIPRDRVYCPSGNILRAKSVKKNGATRYYNKLACKGCKRKCTKSAWKEIDFAPGKTIVACKAFGKEANIEKVVKRKTRIEKKVRFKFKPDQRKLDTRMSLSEHPFGTVKRWNDGSYLLLKGKEKVTGELSLSFLIYNMKRAINMIGIKELIGAMG